MGRAEGVWHDELELLAAIVEQLDTLARLQYSAATGKRAPGRPLHVPRPGDAGASSSASSTPARMAELIAAAEVSGSRVD